MTRRMKWIMVGVAAGVLVLALAMAGIGSAIVLAQGGTTTPTPAKPGQELRESFWQALATRLNVTVDQLTQAFKDAAKDTVAKAQQEGKLTADQAQALNDKIDQAQGNVPFVPFFGHGRGFGGRGFGLFPGKGGAGLDAAATALGMSSQDLMTALRSGQTLAQLAQEKNVDPNTVKTAILNAEKAAVDQAVAAGRLTQAQGDQLKAQIDQRGVDLNQPFWGHGFKGGPWRKFGPFPQQPTPTPGGILF